MTIIRDIYDKIGVVLREMRPTVGHRTFDTRAVYELYAKRYPGDVRFMKERQRKHPRAHSLEPHFLEPERLCRVHHALLVNRGWVVDH